MRFKDREKKNPAMHRKIPMAHYRHRDAEHAKGWVVKWGLCNVRAARTLNKDRVIRLQRSSRAKRKLT